MCECALICAFHCACDCAFDAYACESAGVSETVRERMRGDGVCAEDDAGLRGDASLSASVWSMLLWLRVVLVVFVVIGITVKIIVLECYY